MLHMFASGLDRTAAGEDESHRLRMADLLCRRSSGDQTTAEQAAAKWDEGCGGCGCGRRPIHPDSRKEREAVGDAAKAPLTER